MIPLRTLELGKKFKTPDDEDGEGVRGVLLQIRNSSVLVKLYARKPTEFRDGEGERTITLSPNTMVIPLE